MAIALKETDLEELCNEAQQNGEVIYQQTDSEIRLNLPKVFGRGGECTIQLRKGLRLMIRDCELQQSVRLENHYEQSPPLIAKFHLSSNSRVFTPRTPGIKDDYTEVSGCNYLYHLPEVIEFEEWYKQESIQLVIVLVDSDYLKGFGENFNCLPQPLQNLLEGDSTSRFHQPLGKTTPVMGQVLHQILYCPYQGIMRQMYLESKALELLTLQFTHWAEDIHKSVRSPRLRSEDVERLHHARDILIQQMDNPPSLLTLARQVGLDDCKLKRGFHQVFGTTVFGYLHDYRMERSRQLLTTSQMSVTEVAYAVGYSSLPSFSKAFRKRFGSSPLAYTAKLCV